MGVLPLPNRKLDNFLVAMPLKILARPLLKCDIIFQAGLHFPVLVPVISLTLLNYSSPPYNYPVLLITLL